MDAQTPKDNRDRRLFGTLLASKPSRTRSPLALGVSIVLHLTLLGLLVVLSRPFIPKLAHKLFQPITIIIPEEEPAVITIRGGSGSEPVSPVPPARGPRRDEEPLVFTPGPVTAIPEITPGPETPEPTEGAEGGGGEPRSLADRLKPRTIDPRLSGRERIAMPSAPAATHSMRVAEALRAYNDSVSAETEARRRALDWTIKTKDGKQWGIGPDGKIHLGDITLPAIAFSPPPGRRDEIANRNRDFAEIERQANNEIGRQSFNQRVKAIRARKEKEREEQKKKTENPPITN